MTVNLGSTFTYKGTKKKGKVTKPFENTMLAKMVRGNIKKLLITTDFGNLFSFLILK